MRRTTRLAAGNRAATGASASRSDECTEEMESRKLPLVSCIVPTANRRRFVPEAIRLFLAQDYPEKELVVVDDGEDSVADLIPKCRQIRYLRLERRLSVGARRNLACSVAHGGISPFLDIAIGEDNFFISNLPGDRKSVV